MLFLENSKKTIALVSLCLLLLFVFCIGATVYSLLVAIVFLKYGFHIFDRINRYRIVNYIAFQRPSNKRLLTKERKAHEQNIYYKYKKT